MEGKGLTNLMLALNIYVLFQCELSGRCQGEQVDFLSDILLPGLF